jgi:predicted secreted protein
MTDSMTSLYSAWFDTLPQAFRALVPTPGAAAPAAAPAASNGASMPFPADQIGKAFSMLDGTLRQIYQNYLPLLAKGPLTAEPLMAMAQAAMQAVAGASKPGASQLQLGIERTFGGLGDAFGLRPMRNLEEAWRDMMVANAAKQRAQAEYLAIVAEAFNKGTRGLVQELQAMGGRGEHVESLLTFIRLWAKAIDAPLHEAMQGARGLEVTAKVIRASTEHRQQLQRAIGLASEALYVPTRADLDQAFREIQELKRELRRVKRALPPAARKKIIQTREHDA